VGTRLLALAALAAAACRRAPPAVEATQLTIAVRADVTGIFPNPPINNEAFTIYVNRNVFEGLVRFDERLRLQPALAERWENPDDRTYVFFLRPGVRFSDGTPVTADDVVASVLAARERGWITRDYLQGIESARALDSRTVEVKTRGPYLILLFKLPFGFVLPKHAIGRSPVPPLGTGPYRLEAWEKGREVRLVRNEQWRGAAPAFERVRFVVVPGPADRIAMLERGEAEVVDQVPLEQVERLARDERLRVVVRPTLRVLFLGLRTDTAPFTDPRVREAFDLAIDRRELIRRALAGLTIPATQLVSADVVGHDHTIALPAPDPARARALLAEAGFPAGLDVRLDGPMNRYVNDRQILDEVARQLGEIGVRVQVNALDKAAFFNFVNAGRSPFYLLGFACESGDAGDALDSLMHSPAAAGLGSLNAFGLADAELDRLIDLSNRSLDTSERTVRLQAALRRVARLRPLLPLVVQTEAVALSRRVQWDPPLNLAFEAAGMRRAP
jgi:peptide/nickel transport system substrate-binding protein